jgi:hypothetical protein
MKSRLNLILLYSLAGLIFTLHGQNTKAQNYFPLQIDSLQFFKGAAYTYNSAAMNPPQGSMYRVILVDSVTQEASNFVYHTIRTTRDTGTIMNQCLEIEGGSWLGNKIVLDSMQNLIFLTNKNDSIFLKYQAQLGESWQFYRYANQSKVMAFISDITTTTIFNNIDSIKKITLQYYDSIGQVASHPINGKQIVLSKTYGALSLPDFYFFPEDTGILKRNYNLKRISNNEVYDFNLGDKFCYGQSYYGLVNPGPYYYDYYVYTIQSKFYTQFNEIVNYGRMVEFYDTEIVPGVGFTTNYSVSYDTLQVLLSNQLPLPEEASLMYSDILETRMDSISNTLYNGLVLSTTANVTVLNSCLFINNFEPAPHIDTYGVGIGLYSRDHLYFNSGYPNMDKIRLLGYVKNGLQFGSITAMNEKVTNTQNLYQLINYQANELNLYYNKEVNATLEIINMQGQKVFEHYPLIFGLNTLHLANLASGIYMIRVHNNLETASQKIWMNE